MKTLSDTLFTYAMEHRTDLFLQEDRDEVRDEQAMVNKALDALRAMGGETAGWVERIEHGADALSYLNERAAFLAGLSMGLELGALGR